MNVPPTENKIFISWSGEPSKSIARFLKQWLEEVVDNIAVWVSDVDIAAGSRSMQDIENALRDSKMGIIVTTKVTMGKDWINFEAGALSKEVGQDKNYVIPLLVDFTAITELYGPLNVFQAVLLNRDGMEKLLQTVYSVIGAEDKSSKRIDKYWPEIEAEMPKWLAKLNTAKPSSPVNRKPDEVLDEVLAIVRELRDASKPEEPAASRQYGLGLKRQGEAVDFPNSVFDEAAMEVRRKIPQSLRRHVGALTFSLGGELKKVEVKPGLSRSDLKQLMQTLAIDETQIHFTNATTHPEDPQAE